MQPVETTLLAGKLKRLWIMLVNPLNRQAYRHGNIAAPAAQRPHALIQVNRDQGVGWLAVEDLLAGNMVRVLAVLQSGLAAAEHGAFAQQLSQVGD